MGIEKGEGEIYGQKELCTVLPGAAQKEKVTEANLARGKDVLYRALDRRVV